jgi:c(7)-type cytochrome triheme protein
VLAILIAEDAMKKLIAVSTSIGLALLTAAILAGDKKPPDTITFEAKNGTVTFDHAKHAERAKGDCKTCHDAIFAEDKAPLSYKESMHKKAESEKKSCAACHVAGGKSFETKGNCQKCHIKQPV